jgi:two-component system, sensor histidine kinase and response regulator
MKSELKTKNEISAGVLKMLKTLEGFHDSVSLYSLKGESRYQTHQDYCLSELETYLKTPGVLDLIKEGKHSKLFCSDIYNCKAVFSLITNSKESFIVCTRDSFPLEKGNGLLWDSFFVKGKLIFNRIAEQVTGYTSDQLNSFTGKAFHLLSEEDAEEFKSKIKNFIISSVDELKLEYSIVSKSGRYVWVTESVITERNDRGEIISYVCSLADVSSLLEVNKLMESNLKEFHNLNMQKDQFISVLSHDLKSPYTSILGFSEILLNENSLSAEERTEYLSYINLSSQVQLKLIDNLLEWSRLVTGRKKIKSDIINLKSIVNNVIAVNTRSIHKKELDVRVISDNYVYAKADESLITEVLNILISNAVKYSAIGKKVEIYINNFRDTHLEIIVKDEGVGISEKNKCRIMKMGQVFTTTGTSGERGTGISLLVAQEIIKNHKGELWFYSEEGRGAEFHFTVQSAGKNILFIGNNETEKQKIANMVNSGFPEFKFRNVNNFYDALRIIQEVNPSYIISTHSLPLMNGLDFLKTIRSDIRYASTPVLICTKNMDSRVEEDYRRLGVSGILSEPVDLILLKSKIEENLK